MAPSQQSLFTKIKAAPIKESPKILVNEIREGVIFGRAERLAAAICMAIPFFLLLGDKQGRALWSFPLLAGIFVLIPYGMVALTKRLKFIKKEHYGLVLILFFGAILIAFYYVFIQMWGYKSRNSISQYVIMDDSYIFGLLLTAGAMLFMANGLFYWNDRVANPDPQKRRPVNNFYLGLFLLGVVIFPCVDIICKWPHYVSAVLFYVGCALATARRAKGDKIQNRLRHTIIDWTTAFLMLAVFVVPVGQFLNLIPKDMWPLLNLFGAEAIGLWVIGVDFIMVSLDRVKASENN